MKVLFLSRWFPYPADNGSKIRIWNLLRQLSRKHEVFLVAFHDPGQIPTEEALVRLSAVCSTVTPVQYQPYRPRGARALGGFLSPWPRYLVDTYRPEMRAIVQEQVRQHRPALIIASQLAMAPYALGVSEVPAILEEVELTGFLDAADPAVPPARRWRAQMTWMKLASFLRRTLPRFAACTVASDLEHGHLGRLLPSYSNVHVLPNALDLADYEGSFGAPVPETVIFSGALTYSANDDALRYFLRDIYPRIIAQVPTASLAITGNNRGVDLTSFPLHPGVTFTGYLPDIRPAVARSWVSVVPLRIGGGTRLKILESMALATPVVSTSKGAEGLSVTDGENILIADEPRAFAEKVLALMRSREFRNRVSSAARVLVESNYSWQTVGSQLDALIDSTSRVVA